MINATIREKKSETDVEKLRTGIRAGNICDPIQARCGYDWQGAVCWVFGLMCE